MTADRLRPGLVWEQPARSVEWYTPAWIFDRLGLTFDLDPASPTDEPLPWIPAARAIGPATNGLWHPWDGRVWLNPPFGRAARPFIDRMLEHRDGILLLPARTDTRDWQRAARGADRVTFVQGRIDFIPEDPSRVRPTAAGTGPAIGTSLLAYGETSGTALERARLGWTR